MITAHGAVDSAIEATRLGASGYLAKPFDLRELSLQLKKAIEQGRLTREVRYLRQKTGYERLVGESPAMQRVFETLKRLENVDAPTVLISGESGTGKDLVAQAIHARGPRKDKPYMEIDCAAMPETLIESELFGHEKGAFTDARTQKRGLFELARGGVIFLDEIGEMTLATQAKLLRALENRKFKRVGGVVDLPLDAAIIAATNRNLREEVKSGRFREDLFFRLNVVPIEIPALRKRPEDTEALAAHLLEKAARDLGRPVPKMSGEALQALVKYPWPGNVRELRNVLERVVILKQGDQAIRLEDLPAEIRFGASVGGSTAVTEGCPFELPPEGVDLEQVEKGLLAQALARSNGNQSAAARLLGISRYALRYRMEKFKLN
jgi:two-component system, NtrC family, response regulator AtoC